MNTIYISFAIFIVITAYNYMKPSVPRTYTGLKSKEAKEHMDQNKDVLVIDVRTREEYQKGHIKGARNIPVDQLEKRKGSIPRDKDLILYCQTGGRSVRAIRTLELAGYTRLYNMDEGFRGWSRAGYPPRGR